MNIQNLLKQAQQMQATVAKIEKELNESVYQGSAGGDAVRIEVNGAFEITSIDIEEELLEKESKEMLQDMILLAVNNAIGNARTDRDEKMNAVTQGIKLPGVF